MTLVPASSSRSSGGGSTPAVSCVLTAADMDVSASGAYPVKPNGIVDNIWDFNTLGSLPVGLGLTVAVDGSDGTITAAEDGFWEFLFSCSIIPLDATWAGVLGTSLNGLAFSPIADHTTQGACPFGIWLPAGANFQFLVAAYVDSTDPVSAQNLYIAVSKLG